MRKFAFALLAFSLMAANAAFAVSWTVNQIQTTPPPTSPATLVNPVGAVVTAVRTSGFYISQPPHGAWDAIWVYAPGHTRVVGDFVNVCGIYKEICGLSTIDVSADPIYGYVLKTGTAAVPPANFVTAADLMNSPEQWESVTIIIVDGMTVPAGFSLGSGQWIVNALDGMSLLFDDFWYNFAQVMEGQCYNNATGILHDACGVYTFEPFVGGIPIVGCSVNEEPISMGTIKAMYR
jgi:hypothetical protein